MMKRILGVLLGLTLALPALAQAPAGNFTYKRTLASATRTYCKLTGQLNDPFQSGIVGGGRVVTSGSSTTVTASVAGSFFPLKAPTATAGSVIVVSVDGGNTYTAYRVTAKASDSSITIDTAATFGATGYVWSYYNEVCGTGDTAGWIQAQAGDTVTALYTGGSGTATVTVECLGSGMGALPVQVYPDNSSGAATRSLTAADINNRFIFVMTIDVRCTALRVGFAGTNPIVSAWVERLK